MAVGMRYVLCTVIHVYSRFEESAKTRARSSWASLSFGRWLVPPEALAFDLTGANQKYLRLNVKMFE